MRQLSLSAQNIVKRYGGVVALANGNLSVSSGEVVALIGANGSGKSTLTKVITGVVASEEGQLLLNDSHVAFPNPQAARREGVTAVYQELSLVPRLTVAENIWLAHEPLTPDGRIDKKEVEARTQELLDLFKGTYRHELMPDIPVEELPPDEKQIVEILKALSLDPSLMILDEATASLDSRQVERLFELVTEWKEEGKAIIFISHRMEEIFRIAECYSVLRNGKTVGSGRIEDVDENELVRLMVKTDSPTTFTRTRVELEEEAPEKAVCLEVHDLQTGTLNGVDLEIKEGELVGLGGLQGQGQRDLLLSLFGHVRFSGEINYQGNNVHYKHPKESMKEGLALVPGDRAREGLLYIRSILENLLLPS